MPLRPIQPPTIFPSLSVRGLYSFQAPCGPLLWQLTSSATPTILISNPLRAFCLPSRREPHTCASGSPCDNCGEQSGCCEAHVPGRTCVPMSSAERTKRGHNGRAPSGHLRANLLREVLWFRDPACSSPVGTLPLSPAAVPRIRSRSQLALF